MLFLKIMKLNQLFRTASKIWVCFYGSVFSQTQRLHTIVYKVSRPNSKLIFFRYPNLTQRKDNLYVHSRNRIKFENKGLRPIRTDKLNL